MTDKHSITTFEVNDDFVHGFESLWIQGNHPKFNYARINLTDRLTTQIPASIPVTLASSGPMIDHRRGGLRMKCFWKGCPRKSPKNFSFTDYYCDEHGFQIDPRWSFQCAYRSCERAHYRILHTPPYQCYIHFFLGKADALKRQFIHRALELRSPDFLLRAGGQHIPFISGEDFDRMAFDFSYTHEVKENLRRVIQSLIDKLHFESVSSFTREQERILSSLDAKIYHDEQELRGHYFTYRNLLAQGIVYMMLYSNQALYSDQEALNEPQLSIKIGYTSNFDERSQTYDFGYCGDYNGLVRVVPMLNQQPLPLLGVYFLEQILHAVLIHQQQDRECNSCQQTHCEVFGFKPVLGVDNEMAAAQIRVNDLMEHAYAWVGIIRRAEKALEAAKEAHGRFLDAIKKNLYDAGKPLYYNKKKKF